MFTYLYVCVKNVYCLVKIFEIKLAINLWMNFKRFVAYLSSINFCVVEFVSICLWPKFEGPGGCRAPRH